MGELFIGFVAVLILVAGVLLAGLALVAAIVGFGAAPASAQQFTLTATLTGASYPGTSRL